MRIENDLAIGIDKTTIKGFYIKSFDSNKLLTKNNVIFQLKQHEVQPHITLEDVTGDLHGICYLKITDGHLFNSLVLGVKVNNGVWNPYCFIEMSIAEGIANNSKPLTVSEYHNKISKLKNYLVDIYGLDIDFNDAKFDKLELNITAKMDYDFMDYQYLLKTMVYLTPKLYKVDYQLDRDRFIREYKFYNQSTSAKIYDKTVQLMDKFKIKVEDQYMRIEYTLNKSKDVAKTLGSSNIYKITDANIKTWLSYKITKDLINPTQKYVVATNKELLKLAKEEKATGSKTWTREFITNAMSLKSNTRTGELPLVIDLKQLEEIIRRLSNPVHAARTMQRLQSTLSKHQYAENNFEKFEEITRKFTQSNA